MSSDKNKKELPCETPSCNCGSCDYCDVCKYLDDKPACDCGHPFCKPDKNLTTMAFKLLWNTANPDQEIPDDKDWPVEWETASVEELQKLMAQFMTMFRLLNGMENK
jgi:hypothetical protein